MRYIRFEVDEEVVDVVAGGQRGETVGEKDIKIINLII
jgi:hypothetical protein